MRSPRRRSRIGRWCALTVVPALLLTAVPARAADGFFGFLSSLGGGGGAAPAAPAEAPPSAEPERPLTVRPFRKKHGGARAALAHLSVPGKTGPVSIYEDPTLRTGDAVMTKAGMRVFAGAHYSPDRPYGDDDFVAVSASKSVTPGLKKTLIELNKLPPHG